MSRVLIVLGVILAFVHLVVAVPGPDLEVEVIPVDNVVIVGVETPAKYTLEITNNDISDRFQIYSLIEPNLQPKDFFRIDAGERRDLEVTVYPSERALENTRGPYQFQYEIKGDNTGFYVGRLNVNILEIQSAFEIEVESILPSDTEATVIIRNLVDYDFEDVSFTVESPFFADIITDDIGRQGIIQKKVPLDLGGARGLSAGTYEVVTTTTYESVSGESKSEVKYLERNGISTAESISGTIIRKTGISKTNEGNVPATAEITMTKNVLTRLFTVFSEQPDEVIKQGLRIEYRWEETLAPGTTYSISSTTNYTVPFLITVFAGAILIFVWRITSRVVYVQKRVSFVKTRGGEFALRVRLRVKARKKVEKVALVDYLPHIAKLYEKFGKKPDRIDERTRRIYWDLHTLEAGEERVFTYIMYSKINIVGRLTLPPAKVTYHLNGKPSSQESNKTSFLHEKSEEHGE